MIPNPVSEAGGPATMTFASGFAIACATRCSVQLHGRPCSISSRDIAAMLAASSRVARRIESMRGFTSGSHPALHGLDAVRRIRVEAELRERRALVYEVEELFEQQQVLGRAQAGAEQYAVERARLE